MASEIEFVPFKEFVENLPARTVAKSGDKTVVSNSTDGPGSETNDVQAQKVLAGNVAKAFDPTRTSENKYILGESVIYNGKRKLFIHNHYGAWADADAVDVDDEGAAPLAQSKEFSIVGANLTVQNVYIPLCRGINRVKVKATPNPWPTDTIGGSNPNILIIYGIAADDTETTKKQYAISSTIPEEISIDVSETDLLLRFFVRANSQSVVRFQVVNDIAGSLEELESAVVTEGQRITESNSEISDLNVGVFGSPEEFAGSGTTAIPSKEYKVVGLSTMTLDFSSNGSWPVAQLTSLANKFWLQGYYNNQWNDIVIAPKESSAMKFVSDIPINCKKVRFFVRCDTGTTLQCIISSVDVATSFSLTGKGQTAINKYIRVKPSTEYCLFADNLWDISGITANSNVLGIYASNENLQEVKQLVITTAPTTPYTEYRFVTPFDCNIVKVLFRGATGEVVEFNLAENHRTIINIDKYYELQSLQRYNGYRLPSLLLMGDPHSSDDAYKDYLEISNNRYNALNAIVVLGDMARDYPLENGTYDDFDSFIASCSIPVLPVIGNHDVGSGYTLDHYCPISEVVSNIMAGAESRGFIPSAPNGYYYLDIGTAWNYKTRVIVLNNYNIAGTYDPDSKWERVAYDSNAPSIAYDTSYNADDIVNVGVWTDYSYKAKENVTTPASHPTTLVHTFPCWSVRPDAPKIDAVQAQWLLDTMESTPNYTGIVIVQHSTLATACKKDFSSKFTQQGNENPLEVSGVADFLVEAAKAWEDKNASFSYMVQGESVSKDFSARKSTASFVGFIGGHQHHDFVIRSTTYPKYYEVSANKAMLSYAGDNSDIFTQAGAPSATFVAINRETKSMVLTKIGVDYTQDGYKRDIDIVKQETPANWS